MARSTDEELEHQQMKALIYEKLTTGKNQELRDYMRSLDRQHLEVYAIALLEIARETPR